LIQALLAFDLGLIFAAGEDCAQAFDEREAVEQPAAPGAVGAPLTQQGLGLALPDFEQTLDAAAVDDGLRAGLERRENLRETLMPRGFGGNRGKPRLLYDTAGFRSLA